MQRLLRIDELDAKFLLVYFVALAFVLLLCRVFARPPKPKQAAPAGPRNGPLDRLARARITPNQITCIGLVLVATNSGLYLWHENPFMLGTGLMFSYVFDALDGVVARRQGTVSRFGGYLDAVVDRYQELATFIVIGWVNDYWALVFFVATGSILTSYNKARAAMEMKVDNKGWPDLLERPQRLWIVCVALLGQNSLPWLLPGMLGVLGALTHFTALQRFVRAQRRLLAADEADRAAVLADGGSGASGLADRPV